MSKPSPDKQRSEFAEIISQGKKYLFDEQMERARAEFSQAQSFAEAHFGINSEEVDLAHDELINLLHILELKDDELALLESLVAKRRQHEPQNVPSLVSALMRLAKCQVDLGQFDAAEAHFKEAIASCSLHNSEHLFSLQLSHVDYGRCLCRHHQAERAVEVLEEGLKLYARIKDGNVMMAADMAMYMALAYWNLGREAEAVELGTQVAPLTCHRSAGPNADFTRMLYHVGGYYHQEKKYKEADYYLQWALTRLFQESSIKHRNIGAVYHLLASNDRLFGKPERVERHLRRALKFLLRGCEAHEPMVMDTRLGLINVLIPAERYAEAETVIAEAIEAIKNRERNLESKQNLYYNNLGFVQVHLEKFPKAEASLRFALKVAQDDQERAYPLKNLGLLYQRMGYVTEAIDYYQQALRLFEAEPGEPHPMIPVIQKALTELQNPA